MAILRIFAPIRELFSEHHPMLRWIVLMRLVGAMGYSLSMPFLAIYLHEELHIPMTQVGLLMTSVGIFGAIGSTIGGTASDVFGRKKLMVSLLLVRGLVFLCLAYVVFERMPFVVFASFYLLNGFIGTTVFPIMDALVADVTPVPKRREVFSVLRVASNLGWAIGPAIGGIVMVFGYYWLFLATAIAVFAIAFIAIVRIKETVTISNTTEINKNKKINFKLLRENSFLFKFLMVCALFYFVHGQLMATLSVHSSTVVGLSKLQIGLIYFINAGLVTVFQIPITKLLSKAKPLPTLTFSCLLYAAGYLWVGFADSFLDVVAGILVVTIGEMIEAPIANAYISTIAPSGMTGTYMGAFHVVVHMGWTVGPLIGGVLIDNMPHPTLVWVVVSLMATSAALGFKLLQRKEPLTNR